MLLRRAAVNHVVELGRDGRAVLLVIGHGGGKSALLLGALLRATGLGFRITKLPADAANLRHVGADFAWHSGFWIVVGHG